MGRRSRQRALRGWGILFGVVLVLALVGVVVEVVRRFWWAFLLVGGIVGVAHVVTRNAARTAPLLSPPSAPPALPPSAPPDSHPVPTLRGERVRSRTEARIADFLYRNGIPYEYEPTICGFLPDFHLPQWNAIIEYWGRDDEAYLQRRRAKTAAFLNAGFHLIDLEPRHWPQLEEELKRRLYRFDKDIYRRARTHAPER